MSSDNLYEFAGEFEHLSIEASEILQKYSKRTIQNKELEKLQVMLEKMDYTLNQMDLEASLMNEEERNSISIHTTCRTHYNDIRKKVKEAEDLLQAESRKKSSVEYMDDEESGRYKNTIPEYQNTNFNPKKDNSPMQGFEQGDSADTTRDSLNIMGGNFNDLQDLRVRYGVHFDSEQHETVSEE